MRGVPHARTQGAQEGRVAKVAQLMKAPLEVPTAVVVDVAVTWLVELGPGQNDPHAIVRVEIAQDDALKGGWHVLAHLQAQRPHTRTDHSVSQRDGVPKRAAKGGDSIKG